MAVRVQQSIDRLAALKARTPSEVRTEARLRRRLARLLGDLVARVDRGVADRGLPADEAGARALLGELGDLEVELVDVLGEEVGEEAARAIATVERKVTQARKQLPDALRPLGLDRRLFEVLTRLGGNMLGRFTGRTVEALVNAAQVNMPRDQLRAVLGEMLTGELQQLSRHAVGDARNEATEVAERDLGVRFHRWVTAGDADVRPAHADVDGEVARVGESFSNGWRRPGGLGCRCRLEPVFDRQGVGT